MRAFFGNKRSEYYKDLLIKADLGLHEQIAGRILQEVRLGGSVLDFGAGEGALSARLADLGYKVTAVDKDHQSFKFKGARFECVDFDRPDEISCFVDANRGAFDAVLGIEVIEHVQDQWQYVRRLLAMAKPGGLVVVSTPNTASWLSRMIFLLSGRFHQFADDDLSYGHINPISPWELQLVLEQSGARNVTLTPGGTLPPIYLTGLNRAALLSLLILPLRPFMRGMLDGWCVIATARR